MIDKMNEHYSMTNPASIYDEEALTALELSGRTAAKMNETIGAFNALEEETEDSIKKQNDNIQKMNDVTMPDKVKTEVQKHIDNGEFDASINRYMGDLEKRVDNLVSNTTSGSTTMDAEIIDSRVGADGKTYSNLGEAIRKQFEHSITTTHRAETYTYLDVLPDANKVLETCIYHMNFNWNSTEFTANLPYATFHGGIDLLITIADDINTALTNRIYYRQIVVSDNYVYTRRGSRLTSEQEVTYNPWVNIYDRSKEDSKQPYMMKSNGNVSSTNYEEVLPDANKILENCIYELNFNYGSDAISENLPYTHFTGRIDTLITIMNTYYRQILIGDKYVYTRNGVLGEDHTSVIYGDWVKIWEAVNPAVTKEFVVNKNGGGDYTSLTKCVFDNIGTKNIIHVRSGVYDLIEEYKEYFGTDCFDGNNKPNDGLQVKHGTQFWMDSDAEITFNYTGDNQTLIDSFSPFIMVDTGGELHGGHIICSNCRYAIHDDVYGTSSRSKSVIDGVFMEYDSDRNCVIGGGLGKASHITVQNCVVINKRGSTGYGIFYHNTTSEEGKSFITIKDNYVNNCIIIKPYGPTNDITPVIVCGNKCRGVIKEVAGEIDNMVVYDFNNTIIE